MAVNRTMGIKDDKHAPADTEHPPRARSRIVGAERLTLAQDLAKRYTDGESIRMLASSIDRSYHFVRVLLHESGVVLRPQGGGRGRPWTAEELQQLADLAYLDLSTSAIARPQQSVHVVRARLRDLGDQLRRAEPVPGDQDAA